MKNLKAKMKKKAGFTLIEMLIVVAIVAILIAISIPIVGNALESARDATDQANERAAKAEAVLVYMDVADNANTIKGGAGQKEFTAKYDANNGKLLKVDDAATIAPYGKCQCAAATTTYPNAGNHTTSIVWVHVAANGDVQIMWSAPATTAPTFPTV